MADPFPVTPANAPPASYTDFTAAQRSLYGAGMLPKFNIAIGPQLPGGSQETARGVALGALPGMPAPPPAISRQPFLGGMALPRPPAPFKAPPAFAGPSSTVDPTIQPFSGGRMAPAAGPAAPASSLLTPASRPADVIAPPVLGGEAAQSGGYTPPGAAAPNRIQGGLPPPAPLPPHPADYATWYAGKLAENMQAGAEAGPAGGQGLHFIGPESPRMEAPAHPAAVNVIRGGIPSGGGDAGGGGISPVQLAAIAPFLEKRQEFNLNADAQNNIDLRSMATATRDRALKAAGTDPLKRQLALSEYERQLWALKGGANMGFLRASYKTDPVTGELVAP